MAVYFILKKAENKNCKAPGNEKWLRLKIYFISNNSVPIKRFRWQRLASVTISFKSKNMEKRDGFEKGIYNIIEKRSLGNGKGNKLIWKRAREREREGDKL